ncbi:hypothetical protein B0H14DRAFT_1161435 [Mycena olivaceomarginata]|nr:hypothetical protein B0H14DRAFT_1161435 [Mycena olivaceomarginata]
MFEYTGKRKIQTRLRWSSTPASPELFANLLDTDTESRALGLGRPILILGQFHQKSTTFARIRSAFSLVLPPSNFATEYWQFRDPLPGPFALVAPHETATKCEGNEDKKCSMQFPSAGINPCHTFYFGQVIAVNPLLCI